MKKGHRNEMNDDLRPEYDLSQLLSHSVQGKYAERYRAESIGEHTDLRPADLSEGVSPGSPVRIKADPRRRGVITGITTQRAGRRY